MKERLSKPEKRNPQIDIPAELLGEDVTLAADVLIDLASNDIPNALREEDRRVLEDVAVWLRRAAKAVSVRDAEDWDATLATREDRATQERERAMASRFGIGEATIRASEAAKRIARRVRRIA